LVTSVSEQAVVRPHATAEAPAKAGRGHLPELDGVRGFAILLVLGLHFLCSQIDQPNSPIEALIKKLTGYGRWGVDLFFVLSGFLITGILWDTRGSRRYFKTFYMRRTLRIFPLYYATLLVLVVLIPSSLALQYAPEVLRVRELQGWLWPYLANVYVAKTGAFDIPYVAHFWTLAVEEHFYLFWPFAVGLLSRRTAMGLSVALSVLAVSLRIAVGIWGPNPFYAHVLTPCRLDALCIGGFLALAARGPLGTAGVGPLARRWLLPTAGGVLLTSAVHAVSPGHALTEPLRELFLALCFGCAIVLAATDYGPALYRSWLRAGWLRWLGKYSYGLYVFHGIIAYALGAHHTLPYFVGLTGSSLGGLLLQALVATAVSIGISVVSYELFEAPFLRLKKWFEPSVTAQPSR
jgi:peptidoglycan/LPS O-acetylase OafA/YrhL